MRNVLIFCLLIFSFPVYSLEIPEQAPLKSTTRSFNHQFEVSIIEGKLWYRPRPTHEADTPKWALLGKTGLPENISSHLIGIDRFDSPSSITGLSTDGDNLIATDSNNSVYYMKWSSRKWTHKWGKPFSDKLILPQDIRSWSISHRGPFAGGYNDIDGNFHPVSAGVTTLYVLSADGLTIRYADPWLPADFSHEICGPLRNRFRARSFDASASTIFVISDTGDMYTRLADYDTLGNNPFLDYSYERRKRDIPREKDVRTLPPEEWKKQPSIAIHQGRISSAITIIQTGRGNDARELRVEGVNAQGDHGYFSKPISGEEWTFTRTDLPLQKPLLAPDNGITDIGPDWDRHLAGYLKLGGLINAKKYEAELMNFNPLCSGGLLSVKIGHDKEQLPLFTVASSQKARKMKGAITLPEEIKTRALKSTILQKFIKDMFGKNSFVEINLTIDKNDSVQAESHSHFSLFPNVKMEFSRGL